MLADWSGPCLFIRVGTAERPHPPLRRAADMQPEVKPSEKYLDEEEREKKGKIRVV